MSTPNSASELFAAMPGRVDAAAIGDMDATIQFNLNGDGGGIWSVTFANGQAAVVQGPVDDAVLTLSMDAEDFVALSKGELNPMQAFMGGKIKLDGDMGLAMKLQNIL